MCEPPPIGWRYRIWNNNGLDAVVIWDGDDDQEASQAGNGRSGQHLVDD